MTKNSSVNQAVALRNKTVVFSFQLNELRLQSAMEDQQKHTGLLKQMTKKLHLDPANCPVQDPWPCEDPPSTLETLLLSEEWSPIFLNFLQNNRKLEEQSEQTEPSKNLLKAARIVFSDDASQEKGRSGFKEILAKLSDECKLGIDIIFYEFLKYVIDERKV